MTFATKATFRIETVFDAGSERVNGHLFTHPIQNILRKILPPGFFFQEIEEEKERLRCLRALNEALPLVKWIVWEEEAFSASKTLSLFLLCPERPEVGRFFYDMISRWLLPGKPLNSNLFFSTNFKFPDLSDTLYSLSMIVVSLDQDEDMSLVQNNLEIMENEIRLGVHSAFQASRILESKGLSVDQKSSLIQERISTLVKKRPYDFDYDIFGQMQHFLVTCKEGFKDIREYEQMTRIIYVFYLFQRAIQKLAEEEPEVRHLSLKLNKSRLILPLGNKNILALFIGLNFLKENEVFEEKHLLRVLSHHIPDVKIIEDSLFINHNKQEKIQTLYIEVEKGSGEDFSLEEIQMLRRLLPTEFKGSIEQLVRPIFMPRNEEEVMRNIVTLSNQLKYLKDLPQMIISFDEQTNTALSFTVILLRILLPDTIPVVDLFHKSKTFLKFTPDRVKKVGLFRKRYIKEATVFRVQVPKSDFLREDHSVDLYKARQCVVQELQEIVGEVRDYNGGMISKQIELLLSVKNLLGDLGNKHEFLLENFFHSVVPVEMRSLIHPELLKSLFLLLLTVEAKNTPKTEWAFSQEQGKGFLMIKTQDELFKAKVFEIVDEMRLAPPKLVTVHFQIFEITYLGFICSEEKEKQSELLEKIHALFEESQ